MDSCPRASLVQRTVFLLTLFVLAVAGGLAYNTADLDLWHRFAVGRQVMEQGGVARQDLYSYLPVKAAWIDHEWGSGVLFYSLYRLFGAAGLLTLKFAVLFITLLLIHATHGLLQPALRRDRIGFFFIAFMAILFGFSTTVRCQAFTFLFFALWLHLLERVRRGERRILALFPVTMIAWANLHGGFLAGIGLVVLFAAGELLSRKSIRPYLLILALVLPATLINPYGLGYWPYLIEAVTMPRPLINEWEPLNLFGAWHDALGWKLLLGMTVLGLALTRQPRDCVGLVVLSVTLLLGLRHMKHATLFAISAAVYGFGPWYATVAGRCKFTPLVSRATGAALYALLLAAGLHIIMTTPGALVVKEPVYPVRAVEFIRQNNLAGKLLVPFNWGSYCLWQLYPQCRVAIDGRYEETYPAGTYQMVTDFTYCRGDWSRVLREYPPDLVLMQSYTESYARLRAGKEWVIAYQDGTSAVLIPASQ